MNLAKRLEKVRLIFLDTAPVIYWVEKNPQFISVVQRVFERLDGEHAKYDTVGEFIFRL